MEKCDVLVYTNNNETICVEGLYLRSDNYDNTFQTKMELDEYLQKNQFIFIGIDL